MNRPGITRMELVVLLVIAVVVAGLLLTYMARSRELSQEKVCANNLRLIGAGILGFAQDKKFLPAARIAPDYATWAVEIAPFLQRSSDLEEWDLAKRYADQSAKARAAVLVPYLCPARPRTEWQSTAGEGQDPWPGALGDYACASGDGDPQHPWTGPLANGALIIGEVLEEKDGLILRWQSRTTMASLTRGQSYTILIGEKHVPMDELGKASAGDGCIYNGGVPASSARVGGPGFGLAPSQASPFKTNFGSAHSDICQFLKADGSVRAFANDVPAKLLGSMIRRE